MNLFTPFENYSQIRDKGKTCDAETQSSCHVQEYQARRNKSWHNQLVKYQDRDQVKAAI